MLCIPLYRVVVPVWPERIVERVYPGGRVVLVEVGERFHDDGFSRSRPLNAARVDLVGGGFELGYMVLIRSGDETVPPPPVRIWRPRHEDCELGLNRSGSKVQWLPCGRIRQVIKPNLLSLAERIEVAFGRLLADR